MDRLYLNFLPIFLSLVIGVNCQIRDLYRLETIVKPSHYDVELTLLPGFGESATFTGHSKITLTASSPVSNFEVHVNGLNIDKMALYVSTDSSQNNLIATRSENDTYQKLIISTTSGLQAGVSYVLESSFTGKLYDDMQGFYRSWYRDVQGNVKWIATTQFQPTHARRVYPCFDEPAFKAKYDISLIHPKDLHAVGNTPIISNETYDSTIGLTKTTFQTTPTMSSYLIAFIVSDFGSLQNSSAKHGVYAAPHLINTAQYALNVGPPLVTAMEKFINFSYLDSGIGKMDQVAIPDFSAGAMENWGLITYRESRLLYDENESTINSRRTIGAVIMHEITHMWFGDLVTCDWWSYTWLNEGFARYFQYFGTAWVETEMELDKIFVLEQLQVVLASDASTSSDSLNSECSTPTQIGNKFSNIGYNKGASVIKMVRHFLGDDNWRQGLIDYIKARQFSTGLPDQLYEAWSKYSSSARLPENLSTIMKSWVEVGGYPLVKVSLSGSNAVLTQKQFLLSPSQTSKNEWYVPITYTTSHERKFTNLTPSYWLVPGKNLTIPNILHGGSGWVLVNLQESGYHRVTYDDVLWSQLMSGLKRDNFDNIPDLNRAQIVDDVLYLARARIHSYTFALDVISFLSKDTSYYPWYSAFTSFSHLKTRFQTDSTIGKYLKDHILKLMGTLYETLTFDKVSSESFVDVQKKALALSWACTLSHPGCISSAQTLFSSLRNNSKPVNSDVRNVVYCTALRNSNDNDDWYFLWNKLKEETLATETSIIITALGCTKNQNILNAYMTNALNKTSGIRRQDFTSVFAGVYSGNDDGVNVVLEFLKKNYQAIVNYNDNSSSTFLSILSAVAGRMTSESQITNLENWLNQNSEQLSSVSSSIKSYITSARNNLKWDETTASELSAYYVTYFDSGSNQLFNYSSIIFMVLIQSILIYL